MATKTVRYVGIAVVAVIALLLLIAISIPLFLNTDTFRQRIETTLSTALGRKVSVQKLDLSVLSGSLVAHTVAIADDPVFSTQPFLQAATVKINVEMLPLLLSRTLHIEGFTLESPQVTLLHGPNNTWNYSSFGNAAAHARSGDKDANDLLPNLTVGHISITDGQITIGGPNEPTRVYSKVALDVKDFTFLKPFPFNASAQLPGKGNVNITGTAGPVSEANAAATPLQAQIKLDHVDLSSGAILPADSGAGGIANLDAKLISNGQTVTVDGTAHVEDIRLAKDGTPAPKPVDTKFSIAQNLQAQSGEIKQTSVTIGKATINLGGTYQTSGATTALNLRADGQSLSIDELEAFLPALGVHLPTGSRLQGGTLSTTLDVTGSSGSPVINGPVRIANSQLAGFDIGQKLQALGPITGIKPGTPTVIRSLSMNLHQQAGAVRTDNIAVDVSSLGTATGNGSISAAQALDYRLNLKPTILSGTKPTGTASGGGMGQLLGMVSGGSAGNITTAALQNGITVNIGGTTSNPTFTPDLNSLASSAIKGAAGNFLGGKKGNNNTNSIGKTLGGLFGKH